MTCDGGGKGYWISGDIELHQIHIILRDMAEVRIYSGKSGTVYIQRTGQAGVQNSLTASNRPTVKEALLDVLAGRPDGTP